MSSIFIVSEEQLESFYPSRPVSPVRPWQKTPHSAIIFPANFSKVYSSQELHQLIYEFSTRLERQGIYRFELDIWRVPGCAGENPFAISFTEKEANKGHSVVNKARNQFLGCSNRSYSGQIKNMTEEQYDEACGYNPDKSRLFRMTSRIKMPERFSDNDFYEIVFLPALRNIFGKDRVITRNYVRPTTSPLPTEIQWTSEVAHNCTMISYDGDFHFTAHSTDYSGKISPKFFQNFVEQFASVDGLKNHYFDESDKIALLRQKLPPNSQKQLESLYRLSPSRRDNKQIQFLEQEMEKLKSQELVLAGLEEMSNITDWDLFRSKVVDALKCVSPATEFCFVLLVSTGNLPDGTITIKKEVKAIITNNDLMSVIRSFDE